MLFDNHTIKKYWNKLESRLSPPTYVSKVSVINFEDLKKACKTKNDFYIL